MTEPAPSIPWRLGLDLGVGSLGWAVFEVEPKPDAEGWYRPVRQVDAGVTVFDSGVDKDGQSAATERRLYRSQRIHTRNTKRRKQLLLKRLVELGLLPTSDAERRAERDTLVSLGPPSAATRAIPAVWAWRWRGLNGNLTKHELGHVLMHLASARGIAFSADALDEGDEAGQRLAQATELAKRIASRGCRTFGEYAALELALAEGTTVRARNGVANYCSRQMIAAELAAVCNTQSELLPDGAAEELRELIIDQDFTAVLKPGRCPLVPNEERLPKAHPLAQALKQLQALRNIEVRAKRGDALGERLPKLSGDDIERAMLVLRDRRHLSPRKLFDAIGLKAFRSNYHRDETKGTTADETEIPGDESGAVLSSDKCFGSAWFDLPAARRSAIIEEILSYRENDPLIGHRRKPDFKAIARAWGVEEEHCRNAFSALPRGRSAYGRTAAQALVAAVLTGKSFLEAKADLFPESERALNRQHRLPYYGQILLNDVFDGDGPSAIRRKGESESAFEERRYGRARNPQVHVVVQQLRGLVNALCDTYGKPVEIVLELARDLCEGESTKRKRDRAMRERREQRRLARTAIADLGAENRREAADRWMLWNELGGAFDERVDLYSGRRIPSVEVLLGPDIQIDHIIPRSDCGDDSLANKILTFRDVNDKKGDKTPFEAFSANGTYDQVKQRAFDVFGCHTFDRAKQRKFRRFLDTAREEFTGKFVGRELAATAYAATLVRRYLGALIEPERVYAAHGRLTGRLRKAWELAKVLPPHDEALALAAQMKAKDETIPEEVKRFDHRHHAVDASIIGLIDPTTIRSYFRKTEDKSRAFDLPWPSYRGDLQELIARAIVRHRPKHKAGQFYGGEIVKATRYRLRKSGGKQVASARQAIGDIAFANGQWQLGKNDADFHENVLARLAKSGGFGDAELNAAKRTFEQGRYEAILSRLAEVNGTKENAITPTAHRIAAWSELCNDFIAQIGGRKTFRNWKTMESAVILKDGAAVESGGYGFADVLISSKKGGKRSFRLAPIPLGVAMRGEACAAQDGESHVCRLHPGDMLRLKTEEGVAFVVIRGFKATGMIRVTLHFNAARAKGIALSADRAIEGGTSSLGDRTVNWLFGTMKARIAHIGPLGRPA